MEDINGRATGETVSTGVMPTRNTKIDVLKGLAIISMVAAHCGCPYTEFIYLFHMAVFFMASGYFYNSKNSESLKAVAKYTLRKIKVLWVPYVLCNGLLVLLQNLFIKLNIYTYDPQFLEIGGFGAAWGLQWPYSPEYTKAVLGQVLRFQHEPQLAGACWFLRALFYVSIGHCVIMWVIQKIKPKALRAVVMTLVVVGCCVCTMKVQNGTLVLNPLYKLLFSCYLAFCLGIFIRRVEHYIRYDLVSAVVSFALLYLLNPIGDISLNVGWINTIDFYIICSLLGWILLRSIAEMVSGPVEAFLAYAGKHSMSIVFLHFLSFKLVTLIVILLRGDPMVLLASFPQLDGAENGLWIAYTIVGVVLPLAINVPYQKVKKKLFVKVRGIYESICNRRRRPVGPRCDE